MAKYKHQDEYVLEFNDREWDDLINLSFEPFEFAQGEALTKGQWMALADAAAGKSHRIAQGRAFSDLPSDPRERCELVGRLHLLAQRIWEHFAGVEDG